MFDTGLLIDFDDVLYGFIANKIFAVFDPIDVVRFLLSQAAFLVSKMPPELTENGENFLCHSVGGEYIFHCRDRS